MDERFLQWHAGLRVEASENAFRPFVESNDTGERMYSTLVIRDRADAAVAASTMLDDLREGREVETVDVPDPTGEPTEDAEHITV
jgi:hypothetical protein